MEKTNYKSINISVDKENKVPYSTQYEDLTNLHFIILDRKVNTILEFGLGKVQK